MSGKFSEVEDFLSWIEENTDYEIGVDEQSDWGDGESTFHRISFNRLFNEYMEYKR